MGIKGQGRRRHGGKCHYHPSLCLFIVGANNLVIIICCFSWQLACFPFALFLGLDLKLLILCCALFLKPVWPLFYLYYLVCQPLQPVFYRNTLLMSFQSISYNAGPGILALNWTAAAIAILVMILRVIAKLRIRHYAVNDTAMLCALVGSTKLAKVMFS